MTQGDFNDIQEALVYVFAPIVYYILLLLLSGGILSAIGAIVLQVVKRMR